MKIVTVVEGFGEVEAAPILLRRLSQEISPGLYVDFPRPIRTKRQKIIKEGELERVVELAGRQTSDGDGILILLDADYDCPKELAPALLARAVAARSDRVIRVVLAKREYESWFLAAAPSICNQRGLPNDLTAPSRPEEVINPKQWLTDRMPSGKSYRETLDQPALTAVFDLGMARHAESFQKLCRDLQSLLLLSDTRQT